MEEQKILVINRFGKPLAPTNIKTANILVKREKAIWITEGRCLKLLYTKSDFNKLKKKIIYDEGRKCYICGRIIPQDEAATIDHVYPKSKYGKDSRDNLKCCCKRCNDDKANMSIIQYISHIKRNISKYKYINLVSMDELEKRYMI